MPYADPSKAKQFFHDYHAKNKVRLNARKLELHYADKENRNAISRKYHADHRDEQNSKTLEYRKTRRTKIKTKTQLDRHGMSLEHFQRIYLEQGGVCAICKKPEAITGRMLSVDHNHNNEEIRGLLCIRCNSMLGMAGDSIDVIQSAAKYLQKFEFF